MAKKGGLTEKDIEGLKSLYDTLSDFHQEIKKKASEANTKDTLIVRRYFEKFLVQTSNDIASLGARIYRAKNTLFRKETRSIADAEEKREGEK